MSEDIIELISRDMQDKQAKAQHIKLSLNENPFDFEVKDVQKVPNRYICFIKIKILADGEKGAGCYGSGVLLGERWMLTAAHNVWCRGEAIQRLTNMKYKVEDQSYVKLAVHKGSDNGEYKIVNVDMCKRYLNKPTNFHDYALVEIEPKGESQPLKEDSYPPVVVLSSATRAKVSSISVQGYPIPTNKKAHNIQDHHSISCVDAYRADGPIKNADDYRIYYTVPTEIGVSGGPIFTELNGEHVILGVHKASNFKRENFNVKVVEEAEVNVGVIADQMLEEVNEWGYQKQKRPFIFTERTLSLRKTEDKIREMEIFYLADRGLTFQDIQVITAYDISNLKKIILSGNNLQEKGVQSLTRRPFPHLNALFLPQNNIKSLESLTEQHWKNVSSLILLVLSVNKLAVFPKGLALLDKLETLWLSYNRLPNISEALVKYCEGLKQKTHILLYDNKIKDELAENKPGKERIGKSKAQVVWTKQEKEERFH